MLGADDFDAQEAVLDALREHDGTVPDWEYCEGFLCALVCTRREVAAEEYWPAMLGDVFRPMEHMEFVWRWQRRWQEVADALDAPVQTLDDERCYHPEVLDHRGAWLALPQQERDGHDAAAVWDSLPSYGEHWALGFADGVEWLADEWAPPRDADGADMLAHALDAINALLEPDNDTPAVSMHEDDAPPSVSQARLDAYAQAIWAVYDLRQLWKSLGPRQQTVRRGNEPGRNDPCPCGSGKKYKKCHGA